MRTTLDIADPILKDLKRLQRREGKTLGQLVSELLAPALAQAKAGDAVEVDFRWIARGMGAKLDLSDTGALLDAMDQAAGS
jgi:hypothetical protein